MVLVKINSLLLFLLLNSFLFGQNKNVKLELDIDNQPVRVLLNQIETQTQLRFSYNTSLIDRDSLVSYKSNNKSPEAVIFELFSKRIKAKVIGRHIVLLENKKVKKDKKSESQFVHFSGSLINARNNKPVINASIYDISTRETVLSDSLGQFKISVLSNSALKNYSIAKLAYHDTIVSIDIRTETNVELKLMPISDRVDKLVPKSNNHIPIDQKSEFLMGIVSKEVLITSENLDYIYEKRLAQVSFLPVLGTNLTASGIIENKISLNILGGYNGGVKGLEIGGLFNVIDKNVLGFQVGGLSNLVAGKTTGMQVAGIVNKTKKQVEGLQLAGIVNWSSDSLIGMQIAGISNLLGDKMTGFQIGGISNNNSGETEGVQIAGIVNVCKGSVRGLQMGGIANQVKGELRGFQVGGIANQVKGEFKGVQIGGIANQLKSELTGVQISGISNHNLGKTVGLQIAGIYNSVESEMNGLQLAYVNSAKVNNGIQLGFINVSDTSNGVSIGLFNYVKNGYRAIELTGNEVTYANLTFKSGARHFYNIYTAGTTLSDLPIRSVGLGFGSNFTVYKKLSTSLDLSTNYINKTNQVVEDINFITKLVVSFDYKITEHLALVLGASYNIQVSNFETDGADYYQLDLPTLYEQTSEQSYSKMWIGGEFGLRYIF